jgi:NADH dehydrogenase FAD-containing subunit
MKAATLKSGTVITLSACLIAIVQTQIGRRWDVVSPDYDGSLTTRHQAMKKAGETLIKAESVLVVGGGLIGCELAGDIAYYSKQHGNPTQVTLVHSGSHLVPEFTERAAAMLQKKLEAMGIRVILNEKAVKKDGKMVLQSTGEVIEAQEAVKTVGIFAINDFLKDGGFGESLNGKGFIKTDSFLRVEGMSGKVFAVGDCCTHLPNSAKQITTAAPKLASNLKVTLDAVAEHHLLSTERKLKEIVPLSSAPYLCTVGPKDGVTDINGWFRTTVSLPWIKNTTMFFFHVKPDMGL